MKLEELKSKVLSGEITVDFGNAFLDESDPISVLFEYINRQIELDKQSDEYDDKRKIEKGDDYKPFLLDDTLDRNDYFAYNGNQNILTRNAMALERLTVHSWVVGDRLSLTLNDNVLSFLFFSNENYKARKPCWITPPIPDNIVEPTSDAIAIPSGKLIIANFFNDETINPRPENEYNIEWSLQGIYGRKNLAHHYAQNNNVAYGQTTNTSIDVYSNGKEIIIAEMNLEDAAEGYPGGNIWGPEDLPVESVESAKKLLDYMKDKKIEKVGNICCDVWRWEATDYEKGKSIFKDGNAKYNKPITINVKGSKAKFTHYFDSINKSPFGSTCYSHFWIE